MKYCKFFEIEKLSANYDILKVTLNDGRILFGDSWGVEPARDEDNEELDYDWLVFKTQYGVEYLLNDEIKTVEPFIRIIKDESL